MGVNKVILLGNLGKDPELRYTASQTPVCNFSLATGERRKDASGNWADHTEWHNVIAFGKTAELCSKFLKKGRQVFIEGRIQTRKWQDKEGKDRYTTEIIANGVTFVGAKGSDGGMSGPSSSSDSSAFSGGASSAGFSGGGSASAVDEPAAAPASTEVSFDDDDIPF